MDRKEKLNGAIEVLQEELQGYAQKVSDTKRMINSLRASLGEDPLFTDVDVEQLAGATIRADQFYGQPLATAAAEYLRIRNQACEPAEILTGLEKGGFDFDALGWKQKDRLRSLAMSLAKNTKTFHRLPNGGPFGLLAWYDGKVIRQKDEQPQPSAADEPASEGPKKTSA